MYGDEFRKIKVAADEYQRLAAFMEDLQRRRQQLEVHRKQGEKLQIAFVGNTGKIDVPDQMQVHLHAWLDSAFAKMQSECSRHQMLLTCPAGTNDR
jgi:hypothetical protein